MDKNITDLYHAYKDGVFGRREFLKKLAVITGSTAGAFSLLATLEDTETQAQTVPENDARLTVRDIIYPGATGDVQAHFARPKGEEKLPGVIVIHENRGLNDHIKDVARRFAQEGFLALAPNALSPLGGTPADSGEAATLMRKLDNDSTVQNFVAAVRYLKNHPQTTGKVGVTGFCWGGGITNQVTVNSPDINAAAPFYGAQPSAENVPKIKASMLLHYASEDARINAGIEAFEAALKKANVDYRIFMYEGAGHAFFNDTNPSRYHKEASELAWKRTVEFFNDKLKT